MLGLMSSMDQVIVKRLPLQEVTEQPVTDVGVRCECIDPIFNEPNPDCVNCGGSGFIKAMMSPEWVTTTTGDKKVWVTSAKIIHDEAAVIYDDEDQEVVSSIHAFFKPDEDIRVGDIVVLAGGKVAYVVRWVETVRTPDNILLKDCALEPA